MTDNFSVFIKTEKKASEIIKGAISKTSRSDPQQHPLPTDEDETENEHSLGRCGSIRSAWIFAIAAKLRRKAG
ncbi:hypothetical protein DIPPA_02837 [Diplonema papillatum]|nr:hypothetical protein DIPPA_02837 [Diplonema papillatum]